MQKHIDSKYFSYFEKYFNLKSVKDIYKEAAISLLVAR